MGLLLAVVLVSLLMTSHGLPRPENEDEENEDEVAAYDEGEKLIIVTKKNLPLLHLLKKIISLISHKWFKISKKISTDLNSAYP